MPFVEGYEVDELSDSEAGANSGSVDGGKVAVTLELGRDVSPEAVVEAVADPGYAGWIRTYWGPVGQRATALCRADVEDTAVVGPGKPEIQRIARVVEIDPSMYQ